MYIYIYTHGLVSISIHWNIEFLGRLVLIFKFASVLTRLWNLHASNEPGRPDVILLGASISACEKGRQWQHALSLLKDVIGLRKCKDSSGYRVSAESTNVCKLTSKVFHFVKWFWNRMVPKDILILEMPYTEMRPIFVIGCLAYGEFYAWLCYLKFDCGIWIEDFWFMQDSYLWNSTVLHLYQWGSLIDNQCVN